MKIIIALILGLLTGMTLFAAGVLYNPFVSQQDLSPLAVTDARTLALSYSAVPNEGIFYTNNGEARTQPYPDGTLELWEKPVRQSYAMATILRDGRQRVAGLGIKFSSVSEETKLLSGQALANSVWYVYLPGKGGFFLEQSENYWAYLRDIVVPAYRSGGDVWAGKWLGNMTFGPGALGTAKVTGGSGEFEGIEMLGVESLTIKAWRVDGGIAAAEGRLVIEMPSETADVQFAEPEQG